MPAAPPHPASPYTLRTLPPGHPGPSPPTPPPPSPLRLPRPADGKTASRSRRTPLRRPRRRVPPACAPRGVWGGVGGRARVRVTDGGKASRGRVAGNDGPATALSRHTETPESGGGGGRGTKRPRPRAHSVRARIQAAAGATGRRDFVFRWRRDRGETAASRPPAGRRLPLPRGTAGPVLYRLLLRLRWRERFLQQRLGWPLREWGQMWPPVLFKFSILQRNSTITLVTSRRSWSGRAGARHAHRPDEVRGPSRQPPCRTRVQNSTRATRRCVVPPRLGPSQQLPPPRGFFRPAVFALPILPTALGRVCRPLRPSPLSRVDQLAFRLRTSFSLALPLSLCAPPSARLPLLLPTPPPLPPPPSPWPGGVLPPRGLPSCRRCCSPPPRPSPLLR